MEIHGGMKWMKYEAHNVLAVFCSRVCRVRDIVRGDS